MISEYDEQVAIFKWAMVKSKEYPELKLLNGSLNGVRLSIGAAMKAKAAGMRKGYPDLFLPVPKRNAHGLFVELKQSGKTPSAVSEDQHVWLYLLNKQGYHACVAFGYHEAIDILSWYMGG